MRTWIWTFLVFVAAVGLALVLREHSGNVLIIAPPWHVSVSITFSVIALIALFFVLYVLLNLLSWLTGSPGRFRIWRHRRAERRDQNLLQNGWIHILGGRSDQAEKELTKLLAKSRSRKTRLVAGLAAARASQDLAEYQQRDESLQLAQKNAGDDPQLKLAYATAAAEMYLEQGLAQEAIDLLQPVQDASSRHFHATRLLLKAYQQLGNADRVYELTRLLLRRSAIDKKQALDYIEYAAARRIQLADESQFKTIWGDLRTEEKTLPPVALAAGQRLTQANKLDEAARVLEAAIQQDPEPELLNLYASTTVEQYQRRLTKAEEWLQRHPNNPALLVTLGRLCVLGQLWGQSEHYFKRSMDLRNDLRIHALLGQLYDGLGRHDEAVQHWRVAAATAGTLPIMAPNRLLPAADLQGDPTLVDGHLPEEVSFVEAARPVAASAVDAAVFADPIEPETESSVRSSSTVEPDDSEQHYFDSAPLPGVDVTIISDDSHRSRN